MSLGHERCRIRTYSRCALPDPEDTLLCTLERVTVAKRTGYLGIGEVFLLSLSTKLQIDFNILRAIFIFIPTAYSHDWQISTARVKLQAMEQCGPSNLQELGSHGYMLY